MKPTFRILVLTALRKLLRRDMDMEDESDVELARQLDEAIEQEQQEQKESRR
jgi:hypothetical protein